MDNKQNKFKKIFIIFLFYFIFNIIEKINIFIHLYLIDNYFYCFILFLKINFQYQKRNIYITYKNKMY